MDDDIVLKKRTKKNPWREFEDFLKRIEPAVAAVDADSHPCLPDVYTARKNQGCVLKEPAEYLPAVRFDAAFNGFHYQAVEYILPYSGRFDATTWWYNQLYVAVKCEIIFRGQAVLHNTLHAINPFHRPYPRKITFASNVLVQSANYTLLFLLIERHDHSVHMSSILQVQQLYTAGIPL